MMHMISKRVGTILLLVGAGCAPPAAVEDGTTTAHPPTSVPVHAPREGGREVATREPAPATAKAGEPEISWDTDKDRTFAEFLRETAGSMLKDAAVGIERRGVLRVRIDQSVSPDDTLPLTKGILAGARKDFPDKAFTLSLYDPKGDPILKARYRPGQGVQYDLSGDEKTASQAGPETPRESPSNGRVDATTDTVARSGVTAKDREFATWAEDHGRAYLRYVQADLETNGRLWFGVTSEVKPDDVPELTKSLLAGARKEFARGEIVATVFDPEGEKIGRARLSNDGQIHWER